MKIKALIVDDMLLARRRVRRYLKLDPEIEVVGECADGIEALTVIPQMSPNLVFLDVQMPGLNGFEVLRNLPAENIPAVVFVTAYDEFALQAFEVNALDYLLKPFNRERFYKALNRAKEQIKKQDSDQVDERLSTLLKNLKTEPDYLKRLTVKTAGRVIFLLIDDVDWIEAAGNYLTIQAGKETHLIRETLSNLEAKLDPNKFVRIHRSVIVNIDQIKELHPLFSGDQEVVLRSGKHFTMSRTYRDKLFALLGKI